MHKPPTRFRPWLVVLAVSVWATASSVAQEKYSWTSSSSSAWLSTSNWSGPFTHWPGRINPTTTNNGATDDIAFFGSTLPNNTPASVGIAMNSAGSPASLQVGAIWFENSSKDLIIGNSSTVPGTLRMNGTSVSLAGTQTSNVIFYNSSSSQTLTIQNTAAGGSQTMGVAVAVGDGTTVSSAIIYANTGSTISISSAISETASGNAISLSGGGTLVLSGANSYSGGTTVSGSGTTLRTANGSATGSGTVTVSSGATLSGTGTIIPNTGSTAGNTVTINGTLQPGTDSAAGTLTIGNSSANATVSLNGSATYRWSLSTAGNPSSTAGGSDTNSVKSELVVNGDLTFTPGTVEIGGIGDTGFVNTEPYSWRVATATGNVTIGSQPTFNVTGLNSGSGQFTLSSGVGAVFVTFNPVPEVSNPTLLCAAAGAITVARRRWSLGRRSLGEARS